MQPEKFNVTIHGFGSSVGREIGENFGLPVDSPGAERAAFFTVLQHRFRHDRVGRTLRSTHGRPSRAGG